MPIETANANQAHSAQPSSLLLVTRVAIKRRRLMGIVALTIFALASVVAFLAPNLYTATVVLLPPEGSSSPGALMMSQLSNLGVMATAAGGLGIKNPNDLQVALLKCRSVEDAMAAQFHLQALYHRKYLSAARKRWEQVTSIDNGLKDGLIRISVTDRDPRQAAALANGWVEEYRRFSATLAITEASRRRVFFEREVNDARAALAHAEEEMTETEQHTGVMSIEGQASAMIASAAALRGQVAAKQVEIRAMREFAADHNPDLIRAEQELTSLEGQLAAMDVASDRQDGDLVAPKGKVTQAGLDYARALREVKYRETVLDLLTRQYEAAKVDEARQGPLIQIVDQATVPDRPGSSYKIWILLGALVCALPVALLSALAVEVAAILRNCHRRCGSWSLAIEQAWSGGAR
ncbi:MAG: chain length determinant family protein [Acidobacteriota bacterium]|nr:chain length determinant family protein [Acidobacteriota bacterium]